MNDSGQILKNCSVIKIWCINLSYKVKINSNGISKLFFTGVTLIGRQLSVCLKVVESS
jgi:hypothetical protein